jgi:hypothetical protein
MPRARGGQWGALHGSFSMSLADVLALPQTFDKSWFTAFHGLFASNAPSDGLPAPVPPSLWKQVYANSHVMRHTRSDVMKRLVAVATAAAVPDAVSGLDDKSKRYLNRLAKSFYVPQRRRTPRVLLPRLALRAFAGLFVCLFACPPRLDRTRCHALPSQSPALSTLSTPLRNESPAGHLVWSGAAAHRARCVVCATASLGLPRMPIMVLVIPKVVPRMPMMVLGIPVVVPFMPIRGAPK